MHFIYCRFINASISDNLSLQAKMNRLKWKWGCERSGAKCPHVRKAQLRHSERLFFSSSWARWCCFALSTATHSFNFMFFLRFFLLSALLVHFPLFCCCIESNPHTDTQQRATRVPLLLHHFNTFGSAHGNQRKRHASTLIADKFIDSANMPMQRRTKIIAPIYLHLVNDCIQLQTLRCCRRRWRWFSTLHRLLMFQSVNRNAIKRWIQSRRDAHQNALKKLKKENRFRAQQIHQISIELKHVYAIMGVMSEQIAPSPFLRM